MKLIFLVGVMLWYSVAFFTFVNDYFKNEIKEYIDYNYNNSNNNNKCSKFTSFSSYLIDFFTNSIL